jgi:UDP-N-acetylmuramoylalanine--D-glutamate ligase
MNMETAPTLAPSSAVATPIALVLGLGASGLAMARWLACMGWRVRVADTRPAPPQLAQLQAELPQADFIGGVWGEQLLDADIGLIASSPGLSPRTALPGNTAAIRAAASARGITVLGELELFARALRELDVLYAYRPKVLAITGTNGKTTVTSLTGKLAEAAGLRVEVAGNIGPCLLDRLRACEAGQCLPDVWVLELSSFQLHDALSFAPDAAVVLNITQDHLDWHADMAEYVADKCKIFGAPTGKTTAIINRDEGEVAFAAQIRHKRRISFGLNEPQGHLDFGLQAAADMPWLVQCLSALGDMPPKKNQDPELSLRRLMPAESLHIRGRHNISNALAALALSVAVDIPLGSSLRALAAYRGEPHRVQTIGSAAGVAYIDDSKGTNVGATVAAITSLGAELPAGSKLVMILGGDGKGQDFAPLAQPLASYARAVAFIGKDAAAIAAVLPTGVAAQNCCDMAQAVAWCAAQAQAGDAVLLSPACASLDMYCSYAHRAADFVQAAQTLPGFSETTI